MIYTRPDFGSSVDEAICNLRHRRANIEEQRHDIVEKRGRKIGKSRMAYSESDDVPFFDSTVDLLAEQRWTKKKNRIRATKRYIFIFIVAILTGLVAAMITAISKSLTSLKLDTVCQWLIESETSGKIPDGSAFIAYTLFNLFCVLIATSVVAYGEVVAAGSGIPEIKCILNGLTIRHAVRFKTLVFKVVGVIFSVAGGLPVGKEGPMIHSGSIVGSAVSQGKTTYTALRCKLRMCRVFDFRNDIEKKNFIICGAAAGVAAAFG